MERSGPEVVSLGAEVISPTVRVILDHLCRDDGCHTYGAVAEVCESRHDCVTTVVCPDCSRRFVVDEDELEELRRWTDAEGHALVCGVRFE